MEKQYLNDKIQAELRSSLNKYVGQPLTLDTIVAIRDTVLKLAQEYINENKTIPFDMTGLLLKLKYAISLKDCGRFEEVLKAPIFFNPIENRYYLVLGDEIVELD